MMTTKFITVYKGKLQMYAEIISTEANLPLEKVVKALERMFEEAGTEEIQVGYHVNIEPPSFEDYERLRTKVLEMQDVEFAPPYEEPPYISKLHPYKKHESHKRPIYWHRIRSRPG